MSQGTRSGPTLMVAHRSPGFAMGIAFAFVGVLLYSGPRVVGGVIPPLPIFGLIPVFLWGITRPGVAAVCATLAVGLMTDILRDDPWGVWSMAYLAAYAAAAGQRELLAGQSRTALVVGLAVAAAAFAVAATLAMAIGVGASPAFPRLILDLAATVVVSPVLALAFGGLEKAALIAGDTV